MEIVGVVPAAGKGSRLAPMPISKEIFPLGLWPSASLGNSRSKVASHYLIEHFQKAGVSKIYMIISAEKGDILRCLGEGRDLSVELIYRVINDSPGTPFTIDSVFSFVSDKICALGFPDIIFAGSNIYSSIINRLMESDAQIVLGLFPADQPEMADLVDYNESSGRVERIVIKQEQSHLKYTWGVAVWRPEFTHYMHDFLAGARENPDILARLERAAQKSEIYMGDIIQSAIKSGLRADAVVVSEQPYLDIGTPQNLRKAMNAML